MRVAIVALILCLPSLAAGLSRDLAADPGQVSVRLRPLNGVISVAGTNIKVRSPASTQGAIIELKGFDRLNFRFEKKTKSWIIVNPVDDQVLATISGFKSEVEGEDLRVDLRPAPNHIQLVAKSADRKSPLSLVGFLSIEEYLEGVVASEVPTDWPLEALKAQAIAARSFAVAKIRERAGLNPDWLLESNVTDQVFDYERGHTRSSEAVRATRGEVLMSAQGRVIAANYHSDCGGHTDEARTIWGGGIKTGTAVDKTCSVKRSPWRFVRTLNELSASLGERGLLPRGFKLASLAVVRRSVGGRALGLEARSTDGSTRSLEGERLRAALGYSELKSTLFEIKTGTPSDRSQIEFVGRGFGHGTGLCQWGARELAAGGKSYREILKHYYPLLTLGR